MDQRIFYRRADVSKTKLHRSGRTGRWGNAGNAASWSIMVALLVSYTPVDHFRDPPKALPRPIMISVPRTTAGLPWTLFTHPLDAIPEHPCIGGDSLLYAPEEFVLRAFQSWDLVFLGEPHKVQEHLVFLNKLIPALHSKGVHHLFLEFLAHEDLATIDSLINAPAFDRHLANRLIGAPIWDWAFKEYVDILETIWQVNHNTPTGPRFRVHGINNRSFWSAERNQQWQERDWADVIMMEALDLNEKALVYLGTHHALYKITLPYFKDGKFMGWAKRDRVSHFIHDSIGDRVYTIWLHYLWPDREFKMTSVPFNGYLDSLRCAWGRDFAFDVQAHSLGAIMDTEAVYAAGTTGIRLRDLVDGYIVLNPIQQLHLCAFVDDFVDEHNIDLVNQQVRYFEGWDPLSVQQANDSLKAYYKFLQREFERRRSIAEPCE